MLESSFTVPGASSADPIAQASEHVNGVATEPDSVESSPPGRQRELGSFAQPEIVSLPVPFNNIHHLPASEETRDPTILDIIVASEIRR